MGCEVSDVKEIRGTLVAVTYRVYEEYNVWNQGLSSFESLPFAQESTMEFFFPHEDITGVPQRDYDNLLKYLKGWYFDNKTIIIPPVIELPLDYLLYKNQRSGWTKKYISRESLLRFMIKENHLKTEGEQ